MEQANNQTMEQQQQHLVVQTDRSPDNSDSIDLHISQDDFLSIEANRFAELNHQQQQHQQSRDQQSHLQQQHHINHKIINNNPLFNTNRSLNKCIRSQLLSLNFNPFHRQLRPLHQFNQSGPLLPILPPPPQLLQMIRHERNSGISVLSHLLFRPHFLNPTNK